jgi:DNA-binding NtrC family response regulator
MHDKLKVLVVDDDRRMVKTICDILKVKGYAAIAAHSGEEALRQVREAPPDCVLMDIKMPGIDGVATLKIIKELRPELPVVLMSAYAAEEQIAEAKHHGASTVLSKPIDFQQILSFLSLLQKDESILVVDNDPAFCKMLKDILTARGYQVTTEMEPDQALRSMAENYKLVVILDLKLGAVDGLDVLKDIRVKYPTKPVVMVTGYGSDQTAASIESGMKIGAYASLYKPFAMNELVKIIEEISREKLRSFFGDT